jgi:pseudouridine kinase
MTDVLCIGAATIDRVYTTLGECRMGTSNPAAGRRGFGGVARNVAENLGRLGARVALVSVVGVDRDALLLRRHLQHAGVEVDRMVVSNHHPTAEYVAILDAQRRLVVGAAQTEIFDDFTVADLSYALAGLDDVAWTFADCNLPAEVLAALCRRGRGRLALDGVSVAKVRRLPHDLRGVDLLFLNELEARAYLDEVLCDELALARALRERGASCAVVTCGDRGVAVAGASIETVRPAPAVGVVDVTGAGDALAAGTLFALVAGKGLADAISIGIRLAGRTLKHAGTVDASLSRDSLLAT